MDFVGRGEELAGLVGWCEGAAGGRVRLVTGPGGVGKTRLGVELCARLSQVGWRCVQVADGGEGSAVEAVRAVWEGRVLLVVDYAEVRTGLVGMLRQVAADDGEIRVLLLARSAGEWWERLKGAERAVRGLMAGAYAGEDLPTVVEADVTDEELVNAAAVVFAAEVGVQVMPRVLVEAGPGRARVLDLHAAALVAVLRTAEGEAAGRAPVPEVRVGVADVLGELLEHEERFWIGTAGRAGLLEGTTGVGVGTLRRMVAAACLLGAVDEAAAVALAKRVREVGGADRLAAWLRELYPPADGEWLGSLQPDRLAEHHVIAQLDASPGLADLLLSDLDDRQVLRAVTLLGRASTDQPTATPLLERLLPLLERVITDLPEDLPLLSAISNAIPYPSLALAEADLAITRRILDALGPGRTAEHARWLTWHGTTLAQTGRPAETLSVTEEAVETYRELAVAYPDRYRPDLAGSLHNLGVVFSELGRSAEALSVTEEAVEIRRELAVAYPDRYRPDLARSLNSLGVVFSELGRSAEALSVIEEAVEIRRELAVAYPGRYRPDLASSLHNLGVRFSELGRSAEALSVTEEAVETYRELAVAYPDRYRPDLASSLHNLGILFSELGRSAEALSVTEEAVETYRELAVAYPDRYRPDLANSLNSLGVVFSELGRSAEALSVTEEAVEIRRELAVAYPDRYRPDLANSLNSLGVVFSELGRSAEALSVTEEAVEIRRELAVAYPDRYRPDLASSLHNLGILFSELGRSAEALSVTEEAVETYRELAVAYPDRYRPDLAGSLNSLGVVFSELGRLADAQSAHDEAAELRSQAE
ncbi:tetratricopeptide repeat protein [Actinomadura craniellae]|uniref:tetratricopeptide repeat protein n=1 Tax=Actinomadura craniellae TaxID=2231787 RepID=UPI0011BFC03D|nr:tetratricopeptide repeat protein [Actinomadura craniellae]